jgi:MFS family permease
MTARTSWLIVALAVGAGVLGAFQIGKVPVALGSLRVDLGLSLVAAGWVISLFNLAGVFGGAPMGAAVGRFGDRRMAAAGLLVFALAGVLGGLALNPATILISRLLEGLGFLMVQVAAPALIQRYAAPADQRLAFGIWGAYMGTGQAIVMLGAPTLLSAGGWRVLWFANVALLVAFAAILWLATRQPGIQPPVTRRVGLPGLWRDMCDTLLSPGPVSVAVCFGLYAGNYLIVVGFLPTILIEDLGLATGTAAVMTAFAVLANALGNVTGGILLQHGIARWKLLATAQLVMGACGFGIFAEGLPLALRFALCVVFMGAGGILPASALGAATRLSPAPHLVPTTNGVIVQGAALGQVIGPPFAAAVTAATGGWTWSPVILAVFAAIGLGLALYIRVLEGTPGRR